MSVLLFGPGLRSVLNFRSRLLAEIVARGHAVTVAAPPGTPAEAAALAALAALGARLHPVPLARTGTGVGADLRYLGALRAAVAEVRPDLVFTYAAKPNIWGAEAAARAGVPSVALVCGLGQVFTEGPGPAGLKARLLRLAVRRLYARALARHRRVIFQNPDDLADLVAAGVLAAPGKAAVVPGSGVDLARFAPAPLPAGPVRFLMLSRLRHAKGVGVYAEAVRRLRARHPGLRARLVGYVDEGPDAVGAAELATFAGWGLDYGGARDDVRPEIAAASVMVLPSWYREGVPRAALEAMAMGRPVITTDAPGCCETVVEGQSGLLVPVRDPAALAGAMADLLAAPQRVAAMGAAARARAAARFEIGAVTRAMLAEMGL